MKPFFFAPDVMRYSLCGLGLAAMIIVAGCAGPAISLSNAATVPSVFTETGRHAAVGTKRKDLVYVSAGDSVLVYAYDTQTVIEKLPDLSDARGSCVDSKGNVYVTNFGAADIVEFSHGVTKPARLVIDPDAYPIDCSIDPKTGNLAVLNYYGKTEYSPGNVAIYTAAKGKPKLYPYSTFSQFLACGYDGTGDLVVSGYSGPDLGFAYLPPGGKTLQSFGLQLSYGWQGPAFIRWDGRHLVIEYRNDNHGFIFVRYAVSGNSGEQEGTTTITYGDVGPGPFWVGKTGRGKKKVANTVAASIADFGTYFWSFPQGTPIYQLRYNQDTYGTGVSVSPAQ